MLNICFSLPWNQHSVFGWIVEILFTVSIGVSYFLMDQCLVTLFISICEYHIAIEKMFRCRMDEIDAVARKRPYRSDDVKKLIHESISFDISARR